MVKLKTRQYKGKVLVLGDNNRMFLTVIRSLGRRNLCVHVVRPNRSTSAMSSRYIAKVHDVPQYSCHDTTWKDCIVSILKKEKFDLVIPCDDRTLLPFQFHREEFRDIGGIYLLEQKAFEVTTNKFKTSDLSKSCGVAVPEELRIADYSEIEMVLEKFKFPLALKPESSYILQDLVNKRSVFKVSNEKEMRRRLEVMLKDGPVQVQEYFAGEGVGVEVLANKGDLLFAFQHLRIHESNGGGDSSYRVSVSLDNELLDATSKLMKKLEYTGVAMAEFKVNFHSRQWKLIEINGRFWGSLPLAVAAGADFPYYLYRMMVEGKKDFDQNYKTGIYCRNFLNDLSWVIKNFKGGGANPNMEVFPARRLLKEIKNLLLLRERSDTFVLDDLGPGFFELQYLFKRTIRKVVTKCELAFMSLAPIRKIYREEARRALNNAQTILFVCKGNICRSPFAENYLRSVYPQGKNIMSCGYLDNKARPCPKEAIEAASELGVCLNEHRSKLISEDMIRQADVIFVFDFENYRLLASNYSFAKKKTFLTGLFRKGTIDIEDPYGGDVDKFKNTYGQIIQSMSSLLSD